MSGSPRGSGGPSLAWPLSRQVPPSWELAPRGSKPPPAGKIMIRPKADVTLAEAWKQVQAEAAL